MLRKADSVTLARVRALLRQCARRGGDPVVALNEAGLIDSLSRRRQLMADTLRQTAMLLSQSSLKQLTPPGRRVPHTPLDTQRLLEAWMLSQADELEKS